MKRNIQHGEGRLPFFIGVVLVVGFAIWQVHMGATVRKLGIPGVFEIELGQKAPTFYMAEDRGYDRFGNDYNGGPQMQDLQQCEASCLADERCQALSFNTTSNQCWLKSAPGLRQPNSKFISAVKTRR